MDAWSYISIALWVVMVLTALLVLRYKLFPTWNDVWKGFSDRDYFLAFHLHRRFRRQVLSGKQRYDRYVQQMDSAFLNQYANPKKSPFDNDQENTRRSRMREMLENESFIREHFKDEPFGFQDWKQMLDAWNLTPVIVKGPYTPPTQESTPFDGSFESLFIIPVLPAGIKDRKAEQDRIMTDWKEKVAKFVYSHRSARSLACLNLFLQEKRIICTDNITDFHIGLTTSFKGAVKVKVRAVQNAVDTIKNENYSDRIAQEVENTMEELEELFQ